jgi:hypothetical protein
MSLTRVPAPATLTALVTLAEPGKGEIVLTKYAQALREANAEAIAAARHATPHLVDHNGYDMIEVLHRLLAPRSNSLMTFAASMCAAGTGELQGAFKARPYFEFVARKSCVCMHYQRFAAMREAFKTLNQCCDAPRRYPRALQAARTAE